jgi:hypothetical protein
MTRRKVDGKEEKMLGKNGDGSENKKCKKMKKIIRERTMRKRIGRNNSVYFFPTPQK